jgi:hypothetical protein
MMKSTRWKEIAELVALASVVASLVLVAYELRQSTAVASAQAVTDLSAIVDGAYRARAQNPVLDELIEKGHSTPDSLSDRERSQFDAWLRADMNSLEAVWFFYDNGIISREDFDGYIAAICNRVTSQGGMKWWDAQAKFYASGFRNSIGEWCS